MARFYTRAEQRAYREKRRAQAALVADRLMGKKKETLFHPDADWKWAPFHSGSQIINPFQYEVKHPRTNLILNGMVGV